MFDLQAITAMILGAATPTVLLAAVAVMGRKWIGERIAQGIKHSYDARIEELKSELAHRSNLLTMAHRPLGDNAAVLLRHRVEAFQELWGGIMAVKDTCPHTIRMLDALLEKEFGPELARRGFKNIAPSDVSLEEFTALMISNGPSGKPLDHTRLFAGEYAWSLFFVYRAIHGRITHLYREGRKAGSVTPWYRDKYARSIVASVLSRDEMAEFDKQVAEKIGWIQLAIERKFLAHANEILSGESTSEDMLRAATRFTTAVHSKQQ